MSRRAWRKGCSTRMGFLDLESIHERDDVESNRGLLGIPEGLAREKARRAIAAEVRDDDPVAPRGQKRRDIDEAVNVVWPAVQQHDHITIARADVGISDVQDAGIDLLQQAE